LKAVNDAVLGAEDTLGLGDVGRDMRTLDQALFGRPPALVAAPSRSKPFDREFEELTLDMLN
jgi:hypothetical protein